MHFKDSSRILIQFKLVWGLKWLPGRSLMLAVFVSSNIFLTNQLYYCARRWSKNQVSKKGLVCEKGYSSEAVRGQQNDFS